MFINMSFNIKTLTLEYRIAEIIVTETDTYNDINQ